MNIPFLSYFLVKEVQMVIFFSFWLFLILYLAIISKFYHIIYCVNIIQNKIFFFIIWVLCSLYGVEGEKIFSVYFHLQLKIFLCKYYFIKIDVLTLFFFSFCKTDDDDYNMKLLHISVPQCAITKTKSDQ